MVQGTKRTRAELELYYAAGVDGRKKRAALTERSLDLSERMTWNGKLVDVSGTLQSGGTDDYVVLKFKVLQEFDFKYAVIPKVSKCEAVTESSITWKTSHVMVDQVVEVRVFFVRGSQAPDFVLGREYKAKRTVLRLRERDNAVLTHVFPHEAETGSSIDRLD